MKKYAIFIALVYSFFVLIGCMPWLIPVPGESFYKTPISAIELYSGPFLYKMEKARNAIEILEKKVIDILESKGYQAFVGSRETQRGFSSTFVKEKLAPNSKADAFMQCFAVLEGLKRYSDVGGRRVEVDELAAASPSFFLYNRNGDLILTESKQVAGKKFFRAANIMTSDSNWLDPSIRRTQGFSGRHVFYESEDEFLYRIAVELTKNIPKRN
jgi:hypothetical protein